MWGDVHVSDGYGAVSKVESKQSANIYYWTAGRGIAEVGFVVDNGADVIPVEVKAEVNLQAKSLKVYREKFQPRLSIRTSMADYKREDWLLNLPLWALEIMNTASITGITQ